MTVHIGSLFSSTLAFMYAVAFAYKSRYSFFIYYSLILEFNSFEVASPGCISDICEVRPQKTTSMTIKLGVYKEFTLVDFCNHNSILHISIQYIVGCAKNFLWFTTSGV